LARILVTAAIRPSPAAAIGSVLLALVQIAITCVFLTPSYVAGLADTALMKSHMDFDGVVTVVANRLKHGSRRGLNVVFTGDSVAMEAIDDESRFERDLTERLGRKVDFWFVASHGQTLWETAIVLDQLPEEYRGVVVICVGPRLMMVGLGRLQNLVESPRLALYSPSFDEELRCFGLTAPKKTGIYFVDFGRFFVARRNVLFRMFLEPWNANIHHYTDNFPGWAEADWQEGLPKAGKRLQPQSLPSMLAVMRRQIERLKQRQITVVLVEKPCHPRLREAYGQPYRDYRDAIDSFVEEMSVEYWQLDSAANITGDDFHDWAHMSNPEARTRFQKVLTDRIAELLDQVDLEEVK
jgi:hypothetical protein